MRVSPNVVFQSSGKSRRNAAAALGQLIGLVGTTWVAQNIALRSWPRWHKSLGPVMITAAIGAPYAVVVRRHTPYLFSLKGLAAWLADSTWSAPNTLAGAVFYLAERLRGNQPDLKKSSGSGSIHLQGQAIRGYATTIGIVKAGSTPDVDRHEDIHVFQARLFGPFYLPLVAAHYALATVAPYWLISYLRNNPPIHDWRTYFHQGVYPTIWHERWAYSRHAALVARSAKEQNKQGSPNTAPVEN